MSPSGSVEGRAALGDLHRDRQRVEEVRQGRRHLGGGLEVELLRVEPEAVRVAQHVAGLDRQQRLVRVGVLAAGVVRVAGRDQRQPRVGGQPAQVGVDAGLALQPGVLDLHVDVVAAEDLGERVELGPRRRHVVPLQARQTTPDRQPERAMMPSACRAISSCEMRGLRWYPSRYPAEQSLMRL